MLKLKTCSFDEQGSAVAIYSATDAAYKVEGKGKETAKEFEALTLDVQLTTNAEGSTAVVAMMPTAAGSEEDAFDALADQLERAARALRHRGEPKFCVPAYA